MTPASSSLRPLIEKYYALIDGGKLHEACQMFTEDAKLTFANAEPVYGREAAESSIQYVLDHTTGVKHAVLDVWDDDGPDGTRSAAFELRIVYNLKSGNVVDNPGCAVAIANPQGQFVEQRLYGDLNNVFSG